MPYHRTNRGNLSDCHQYFHPYAAILDRTPIYKCWQPKGLYSSGETLCLSSLKDEGVLTMNKSRLYRVTRFNTQRVVGRRRSPFFTRESPMVQTIHPIGEPCTRNRMWTMWTASNRLVSGLGRTGARTRHGTRIKTHAHSADNANNKI